MKQLKSEVELDSDTETLIQQSATTADKTISQEEPEDVEEKKAEDDEETKEVNDVDDWVWKKDKKEKKKKVEKNVGLKK